MIRRGHFSILCAAVATLLSGCLSSLQTARTLPEGTYRLFVAEEYNADGTGTFTQRSSLDVIARVGLSSSTDVGFRISLPGYSFDAPSFMADFRKMVVESGGFAISTGFGVNLAIVSSIPIPTIIPAVNLGYDFTRFFGTYLSFRDLTSFNVGGTGSSSLPSGVTVSSSTSSSVSLLGMSWGFRIGDKYGVLLEGTYALPLSSGGSGSLVAGLALFVGEGSFISGATETNRRAERFSDRQSEKPQRERIAARTRATQGVSRVTKVKTSDSKVLLTQPEGTQWKVGERACLFRGNNQVACGKIIKSDGTGAVLKYSDASELVTVGMEATAGDVPTQRSRPQPQPDPEDAPDVVDPAMGELPE